MDVFKNITQKDFERDWISRNTNSNVNKTQKLNSMQQFTDRKKT